jgi:hypothetical protein
VKLDPDTGRANVNLNMPSEPGDYTGPVRGYTGERPAVFFTLPVPADHPDAGVRYITEPPHAFREEPDGTLTISPSILAVRPDGNGWHGYLERGVWREV